MTINGRTVVINFTRRPPRIVAQRSRLALPALWPGRIEARTAGGHKIIFKCAEAILRRNGEEAGVRYVHPNFELLLYHKIHDYVVGAHLRLQSFYEETT